MKKLYEAANILHRRPMTGNAGATTRAATNPENTARPKTAD